MDQSRLDRQSLHFREAHLFRVEAWKKVCLGVGRIKLLEWMVKDPSEVYPKLVAFNKVAKQGNEGTFLKKKCLNELSKVLDARLKDNKWNPPFWDYINQLKQATINELTRVSLDLLDDMLLGVDKSSYSAKFRLFCESESGVENLNFLLALAEMDKRLALYPDNLLLECKTLISDYDLRSDPPGVNISGQDRIAILDAVDNKLKDKAQKALKNMRTAVKLNVSDTFSRFWVGLKA